MSERDVGHPSLELGSKDPSLCRGVKRVKREAERGRGTVWV